MKKDKRITSRDIMERLGIQRIQTLMRWYQRGLIPEPKIGIHPSGRGKMGYWPHWVLSRCIRIRQLLGSGKGLDEIAALLGSDWEAEAAKSARREYNLAAASAELDFQAAIESLRDLLWYKLEHFCQCLAINTTFLSKQFGREVLSQCVDLVREGENPVLVYNGGEVFAVADFVVGQMLAKSATNGQPWLVMPVYREVYQLFASILDLPSNLPTVRPAAEVDVDNGETTCRREVVMLGLWDFELKKRRKGKRL